METDPSLAQFVGRFVPLKVTSTGDEWQQWASKFKKEGSTIPIIYVVRADGEQLYGKSGSLKGGALLELLITASAQSGRVLNEAEYNLLESCNMAAESAIAEGAFVSAAHALQPISKMGVIGNLQSYAELAMKADTLALQIGANATSMLTSEVTAKLKDPESVFEGIVELTEAEQVFYDFPGVKPATDQLIKEVKKDKMLRSYLKPASALIKARLIARSPKPFDKKRADKAYSNIIARYGETPAGAIARKELTMLNPDSEGLSGDFVANVDKDAEPADAELMDDTSLSPAIAGDADSKIAGGEYRNWGSANGKYSIQAKLIEKNNEFVVLKKPNGSTVNVPLEKLDQSAKDFLNSQDQ